MLQLVIGVARFGRAERFIHRVLGERRMTHRLLLSPLTSLAILFCGLPLACTPPDAPSLTWRATSPEAQGIGSAELAEALEFARAGDVNIHSLTIVRNGALVLDAYFYPYDGDMRHDVASVTKSITALLLGMAIAEGQLQGTEQPIIDALPPQVTRVVDGRVREIRLRHLVAMQSGFDCGFNTGEPELAQMLRSSDWIRFALRLPVITEPGTRFGYCSPNFHLLSAAITTAAATSTLDFARARLFRPLGISDVHWPADAQGFTHGWGDLQLKPLDMARIGQMLLERGRWHGKQIVPASWLDSILHAHATVNVNEAYGFGWWLSRQVPTLFEANGRGGQRISVIPARNVVIVMTGGGFEPGTIGGYLLRAIKADTALARDPQGEARLATALQTAAAPPAARAVSRSDVASAVSGRVYDLKTNLLGVRTLSVEFGDPATAVLRLELEDGETLVQQLGLDGVYRLSPGQYSSTSAGRAEWLPNGELRIEFNTLTRINRYVLDVTFSGDSVYVSGTESTQHGTITLEGTGRPVSR